MIYQHPVSLRYNPHVFLDAAVAPFLILGAFLEVEQRFWYVVVHQMHCIDWKTPRKIDSWDV
jgi:hypothetical protein